MRNLPIQPAATMSSREIAELTGKRHDHVIRDIKSMLEQVLGHSPDLGNEQIKGISAEKDYRGYIKVIHLDHSHTITLITGYSARQRKMVVDRWLELERHSSQPAPAVPKTYAAALLEAGRLALENERLETERATLLPRAEAHDRLSAADGSLTITEAAKALKTGPKALFSWLSRNGWIYRRTGSASWLGYQAHTRNGDLEHKVTTVSRPGHEDKITEQVRVTAQGMTKLAKLVKGDVA